MARKGKSFSADIRKFGDLTAKNMRYVAASAIQDVVEAAMTPQPGVERTGGSFEVGKIPVKDGDLINSLTSSVDGAFAEEGAGSYVVAIANYEIGATLRFSWTAEHALAIEAGTSKIAGRHFVGANAERFSEFVEKRVREVSG